MFNTPQQLDLFDVLHVRDASPAPQAFSVLPPQSSASYHLVLSDALQDLQDVWHAFYRVLELFSYEPEDRKWSQPEVEMLHEVQDRVNTLRAHWPGLHL